MIVKRMKTKFKGSIYGWDLEGKGRGIGKNFTNIPVIHPEMRVQIFIRSEKEHDDGQDTADSSKPPPAVPGLDLS